MGKKSAEKMRFCFRCALPCLLPNQYFAPRKREKLLQKLSPPEFFFLSRLQADVDRTTFSLFLQTLINNSAGQAEAISESGRQEEQF